MGPLVSAPGVGIRENSGERAGGPLMRAWLVGKLRLEEAVGRTNSSRELLIPRSTFGRGRWVWGLGSHPHPIHITCGAMADASAFLPELYSLSTV